jgi:hypothetical protein
MPVQSFERESVCSMIQSIFHKPNMVFLLDKRVQIRQPLRHIRKSGSIKQDKARRVPWGLEQGRAIPTQNATI